MTLSLRSVDYLKIALCGECNYRCEFCSQDALRSLGTLDVDILMQRVLMRHVPRLLILTGGEPLLHRQGFCHLARYCAERSVELGIFSNMALVDDEILDNLANVGCKWFRTTLNGSTAASHERSYPVGSFDATLRGIRRARQRGILVKGRMTVTSENRREAAATAALAARIGITELDFRPYAPLGSGQADGLQLKVQDHIIVTREILRLNVSGLRVRLLPNWFEYAFAHDAGQPAPCNCGKSYLYIDPKGDIRPCAGYQTRLGSIRDVDINDLFSESPLLVQIRKEEFGSYCAKCPVYASCRPANCHLMNFEAHRTLKSVNPLCPLYRLNPTDPGAAREQAVRLYTYAQASPDCY